MAASTSNEELRKKHNRGGYAYIEGKEILDFVIGMETLRHDSKDLHVSVVDGKLVMPPFVGEFVDGNGVNRTRHEEGPTSFMVSFGVDPYRYAILLTTSIEPMATSCVSSGQEMWAVMNLKGKIVVKPLTVAYSLDEKQFELAVLMAAGVSSEGRKTP